MSGIWEVYLWRVIDKSIRNNSGNCHIVGVDQILMSPIELLKDTFWIALLGKQASPTMPIGLNEGNVGRSVCPGFGKSTYGASLTKASETILETATL